MKIVKVLGSGCKKCEKTTEVIRSVADRLGAEIEERKETDAATIMGYGVMSTPAAVVDEQLVHSGSIPSEEDIKTWLETA
jgi:small redox-active disulfide protein 2